MGQYINYYNSKKNLWDFKENMNRDLLFLEGFQGQKAIPQNCHTLTAQSAMQFAVLMKPRVGITHCFMDLGGQSFFCFFSPSRPLYFLFHICGNLAFPTNEFVNTCCSVFCNKTKVSLDERLLMLQRKYYI